MKYALRVLSMPEADHRDFYLRRKAGEMAGDSRDSVAALTAIARKDPTLFSRLHEEEVNATLANARKLPKEDGAYVELLQALFDANYQREAGLPADHLWRELAAALLERGAAAKAEEIALRLSSPNIVSGVRVDKRFAGIVAAHPGHFEAKNVAAQSVARWQAAVREQPRSLLALLTLSRSLTYAGRSDEALQLVSEALRRIDASPSAKSYDDAADQEAWVRERRSNLLWSLGRWQDSIDEMERASKLPEDDGPNTSNMLDLADRYCALGRAPEALEAIARAETPRVNAYGHMVAAMERAIASDVAGDAHGRAVALAFLREHESDSPSMVQTALVRTGDLDGAARVLIARLADPLQRLDALLSVQKHTGGAHSAVGAKWTARMEELRARADVQAALEPVGRIEADDLPDE
jgi:tetratricopeptide (TPR) repeat protein